MKKKKEKQVDGRKIVTGSCFPFRLREAQRQAMIMTFERVGKSTHSCNAHTLGVLVHFCIENKVRFTLSGSSLLGFHLRIYGR